MITADTNIFVYLHDEHDSAKRTVARQVVARLLALEVSIGLQVVGEFQNALTRKLRMASWVAARESRNLLEAFDTFAPTRSATERALEHVAAGRTSYWDALLLATASENGFDVLLSEDMGDGETRLDVRILNPFSAGGVLAPAAGEALGL